MIGERISHYRVIDLIGEGGMGTVYKAEDLHLHRMVALKILPSRLTQNAEAQERFIQEARAASALDHPNICTIYDFDQTPDGRLFIAMALYEGETLDKYISRGTLTLSEILSIVIQIAAGLAKAHAKGIIHRDIKPANIVLTTDQQVKILDFGLAKLAGVADPEYEDTASGTTAYMSPEQAQGQAADDRSDIWSTGVVMYELLTGRRPFGGQFRQSVIYSIINEQPPELAAFGQSWPPDLQPVIDRALKKKPEQRYPHILEFLDELGQLRDKLHDRAQPQEQRISEKPHRRWLLAAAAAALVVLVLAVRQLVMAPEQPGNTITVLPFAGTQHGYQGRGVARELLATLADYKGLTVVVPSSTDSALSVAMVRKSLKARYVLRGSIETVQDRARLRAELIQAADGEMLWSESFESPWSDIRNIEAVVAQRVAAVLGSDDTPRRRKPEINRVDPQAYDYYLKGREYYYRYRHEDNETAIALLQKSIGFDPAFAPAHAALADAFAQRTLRFRMNENWLDSCENAARRALSIDPESPEAYKALAMVAYTNSRFTEARDLNRKALDFNPAFSPALANLGWTCLNLGILDSAAYWLDKALLHNPTNPAITLGKGLTALCTSDFDQSRYYLEKTLDMDPGYRPSPAILLAMLDLITLGPDRALENIRVRITAHPGLSDVRFAAGDAALQAGNPGLAAGYYQEVFTESPQAWHPFTGTNITTALGYLLNKTGYHREAAEMLDRSMRLDRQNLDRGSEWWGLAYDLAAVHAIQGRDSLALDWLGQAVQKGFVLYRWLEIDPLFENLRGDTEFKRLAGGQAK